MYYMSHVHCQLDDNVESNFNVSCHEFAAQVRISDQIKACREYSVLSTQAEYSDSAC